MHTHTYTLVSKHPHLTLSIIDACSLKETHSSMPHTAGKFTADPHPDDMHAMSYVQRYNHCLPHYQLVCSILVDMDIEKIHLLNCCCWRDMGDTHCFPVHSCRYLEDRLRQHNTLKDHTSQCHMSNLHWQV